MKGRAGDFFRTGWALFYWNARKSAYVLRQRRGPCPCQNPSDSGRPMETGCEAVTSWRQPERFRRVCPLLARNAAGQWVCSVPAAKVKPFWGRAFAYYSAAGVLAALVAGFAVFGFMRNVGFEVTLAQVFWPPAWHELKEAEARFFLEQAREHYAHQRIREVLRSLSVAQSIDPDNYEVGMMLARFYQVGNPSFADVSYARLLREHPEHGNQTAQIWFRSLLARNRLEQVAELARRQLTADPRQAAVWTNALIFSARQLKRPELLGKTVVDAGLPAPVRSVLALAGRVERATTATERGNLLLHTPLAVGFAYDQAYRVERLIANGFAAEALAALRASADQLSGRDTARLTLAAYAAGGNQAQVRREFAALLAAGRPQKISELNLLALHLVKYPDPGLLRDVIAAMDRLPEKPVDATTETYVILYSAAGILADSKQMDVIKGGLRTMLGVNLAYIKNMEQFFLGKENGQNLVRVLPEISPLSLELNYELLARYPAGSNE